MNGRTRCFMSRSRPKARTRHAISWSVIVPAFAWASAMATPVSAQRSREDRFVDSVLARLTLDEKLGQLNQLSGMGDPTGPGGTQARTDQIRRGQIGSFLNVVGADTTR